MEVLLPRALLPKAGEFVLAVGDHVGLSYRLLCGLLSLPPMVEVFSFIKPEFRNVQ